MARPKRAALYVRVSTDAQTVENQISELSRRAPWLQVVEIYKDAGMRHLLVKLMDARHRPQCG
jgi:DNA invertase Pin-like site-specific DNA recombinase